MKVYNITGNLLAITNNNNISCMCNTFTSVTRNDLSKGKIGLAVNYNYILLYYPSISDLELSEFKTWIEQNPIDIYYILATPTEENVLLPSLKTFKDTNLISVDSTISSSTIKAKYIKK